MINMADGDNGNIFVYLGGDQVVPDEVTHAIIDPSVRTVRRKAFYKRWRLVSVIFHDGVEIIEQEAFDGCVSLPRIKLLGVREIGHEAFCGCFALTDVECGDRLETIGNRAFSCCSLCSIKIPTVRNIRLYAFSNCMQLTDAEFGINLETIGVGSFSNCPRLRRIAIPLKDGLFPYDDTDAYRYNQFSYCWCLKWFELVGAEGIQNTISSLLLASWRDEMSELIDRINRELPNTLDIEKTNAIRQWISSVINRMTHYKAEHNRLLKEHMTQLELAIWKAKLDEKEDKSNQKVQAKRVKIDEENARKEKRITSGADIIIKNVLPFLELK